MSDLLTIEADPSALLAALDHLGAQADIVVDTVAHDTAERIQREAKARIARRTGQTAEAIVVEKSRTGTGWIVLVGADRAHIGFFLEVGTRYMMKRPFFFPSARLEEAGHLRRMSDALQAAIDAEGLGA